MTDQNPQLNQGLYKKDEEDIFKSLKFLALK